MSLLMSLLMSFDRLRMCPCKDTRKRICESFVSSCHPNWHRSTYTGVVDVLRIRDPPHACQNALDLRLVNTHNEHIARFRDIMGFVSKVTVERFLRRLESIALEPQHRVACVPSDSSSESDCVSYDHETFSNPPRERRKRKRNDELDDEY